MGCEDPHREVGRRPPDTSEREWPTAEEWLSVRGVSEVMDRASYYREEADHAGYAAARWGFARPWHRSHLRRRSAGGMLNYSRAYFRDPDGTVLEFDELRRQPILRIAGTIGSCGLLLQSPRHSQRRAADRAVNPGGSNYLAHEPCLDQSSQRHPVAMAARKVGLALHLQHPCECT